MPVFRSSYRNGLLIVHASTPSTITSPYRPRGEDIERWAFDSDAVPPIQDWDLILAQQPHGELYLRLACSTDCPQSQFFLSLLYLIVGNAVRSDYASKPRYELEHFLNIADRDFGSPELILWARRYRALIANPSLFNYTDWCCGALARSAD
jgi:hypothetical protein